MIGAVLVGLVAGVVALFAAQLLFASVRSIALRAVIALLFAAPAAVAGYHAVLGISALLVPSEIWRHIFAAIGGLAVGVSAAVQLAAFAGASARPRQVTAGRPDSEFTEGAGPDQPRLPSASVPRLPAPSSDRAAEPREGGPRREHPRRNPYSRDDAQQGQRFAFPVLAGFLPCARHGRRDRDAWSIALVPGVATVACCLRGPSGVALPRCLGWPDLAEGRLTPRAPRPQRRRCDFLPLRVPRIPREARKSPSPVLRCAAAAAECVGAAPGRTIAIEAAMGAADRQTGDSHGDHWHLHPHRRRLHRHGLDAHPRRQGPGPAGREEQRQGPDFRIFAGRAEIGAAWKKTSNEGRDYLSVKLDDPSLPAPILANLFEMEGGEFELIWSRPNGNRSRE